MTFTVVAPSMQSATMFYVPRAPEGYQSSVSFNILTPGYYSFDLTTHRLFLATGHTLTVGLVSCTLSSRGGHPGVTYSSTAAGVYATSDNSGPSSEVAFDNAISGAHFAFIFVPIASDLLPSMSPPRLSIGRSQLTSAGGTPMSWVNWLMHPGSSGVDALVESIEAFFICTSSTGCSFDLFFLMAHSRSSTSVSLFTVPEVVRSNGFATPSKVTLNVPYASAGRLFTFDLTTYAIKVAHNMRLVIKMSLGMTLDTGTALAGNEGYYASSCAVERTSPCTLTPGAYSFNWRWTARPLHSMPQYFGGALWSANFDSGVSVAGGGVAIMTGRPYQTYIDLNSAADTGGWVLPRLQTSTAISLSFGIWVRPTLEQRDFNGSYTTVFAIASARGSDLSQKTLQTHDTPHR